MPIPSEAAIKPVSVKVHVSSGAGVDVTWSDGHASHYDFAYLRDQCPCAMCGDERRKKEEMAQRTAPGSNFAPLPIFKPKPRARAAQAVGNYAVQIDFTDGHNLGIYTYDYLRAICPCEACAREYR